jgi:glutamate decarboxylase
VSLFSQDLRRYLFSQDLSLFHEQDSDDEQDDVYDMAQMTMGCGRRADSLKMALGWIYYGKDGYQREIRSRQPFKLPTASMARDDGR